jgi:DHA1 family multidrug resistance protein-like MFS transporter
MIGDLLGGSRGGSGGNGQGGIVVASYQIAGDIGTVTGPVAVGSLVAVSYSAAFVVAAGVLGLAAIAGLFAREIRQSDAGRLHVGETACAQPHCDPA